MNKNAQKHPFAPVFDEKSKVLILGSFPSESSEEAGFYYGDTGNRFWNTLGEVFQTPNLAEKSKDEKKKFLKYNKIALWDIWAYCYKIPKDSPFDKDIQPNDSQPVDLTELFEKVKIKKIFTTIGGSKHETSKSPGGLKFAEWKIEKWLWSGAKYGDKEYGGYAKYFRHCKTPSEMVTPLYSTSPNSRRAKKTDEILLDDYRQIKDFLEKIRAI